MNTIEEVLDFNQTFVEEKRYEQFETDQYPREEACSIELHGDALDRVCFLQRSALRTAMPRSSRMRAV